MDLATKTPPIGWRVSEYLRFSSIIGIREKKKKVRKPDTGEKQLIPITDNSRVHRERTKRIKRKDKLKD